MIYGWSLMMSIDSNLYRDDDHILVFRVKLKLTKMYHVADKKVEVIIMSDSDVVSDSEVIIH